MFHEDDFKPVTGVDGFLGKLAQEERPVAFRQDEATYSSVARQLEQQLIAENRGYISDCLRL